SAADQLRDHAERRDAAPAAVEFGNGAEIELVDDGEQGIAGFQQFDLAGDDTGGIALGALHLLVRGAKIDIGAGLDQNRRGGFIEPGLEHQYDKAGHQQDQRDQQDSRQSPDNRTQKGGNVDPGVFVDGRVESHGDTSDNVRS